MSDDTSDFGKGITITCNVIATVMAALFAVLTPAAPEPRFQILNSAWDVNQR